MLSSTEASLHGSMMSYDNRSDYFTIRKNLTRLISIYEDLVINVAIENLVCLAGGEPKEEEILCAEKLRILLKEAISSVEEYINGLIDETEASIKLHAVVEVIENNPCANLLSQYVSAAAVTYLLAETTGGVELSHNGIAFEARRLMDKIDGIKSPLKNCAVG